jgi:aldose 1-epimerase
MGKRSFNSFCLLLVLVGWSFKVTAIPGITIKVFGEISGQTIYQYTLTNKKGLIVKIITYGASITDVITPDNKGKMGNVVFGFDSLSSYTGPQNALMGAVVGRVANRIAGGTFKLNGQQYLLSANIHGGKFGFDKKIWVADHLSPLQQPILKLNYLSKDGEEGYPGNLKVSVSYQLTEKNELVIRYEATTDKPTHINLTNHSYFNLSGGSNPNILDTKLYIASDQYLEAGNGNIPTGTLLPVKGTPLDFNTVRKIGDSITQKHPSLVQGKGYDLTYVLKNQTGNLKLAATAYEPTSGRLLEAYTTEPGLVFYTANHFSPKLLGRSAKATVKHGAFCLETQHYPDSPNQPSFPTTILNPGQIYKSETVFKFSVK